MENWQNDKINPLSTFADEEDERYAILLGVMAALTNTKVEEMALPGIDQEMVCRIVVEERPYLLGGYYATKFLSWIHPHIDLLSDGVHANDIHAFVYGVDAAIMGESKDRYSVRISPEGKKDIESSSEYFEYGYSAGKFARWFV